ncbi:hypothetical protein DVK85_06700 [Flavobacterium arcticum]|uniref:Uncharacterized protein n=1 Tax=Flavobacterium arcticum TaxID=1784713 RepID=A0A345HBI9_9FLAO|nr:hypothetical protein [Flavobacterium arcticum]AXG73949.1 hypothetical protein DVK85_06700 [Flavobacterium arcticum]KAF2508925.1 hypothetical protein E0W72_10185 [Flavobacterium arcticum]
MSSIKTLLAAEFEALKADIIAKYEASGLKASGNWATTLAVQTTDSSATLMGAAYADGRPPGKQPPSEAILQWIKVKGIAAQAENNISLSSLAYLIARKIAREGWTPQQSGSDIAASVATPQRMQQIIDRISDVYITQFSNDIINFLKQNKA